MKMEKSESVHIDIVRIVNSGLFCLRLINFWKKLTIKKPLQINGTAS